MINTKNSSSWEEQRKKGRLKYSLINSIFISALIGLGSYLVVYFTKYKLKTSYLEFGLVLFGLMFIYKFLRIYFYDWPNKEKKYLNGKN
jgi:predicted membrane-bound spermidine synthase